MDTVYGTKKYFQSLSGSDIYRSSTCRAVANDFSYQNSMGRRSSIGAYYHMSKQPSYSTEHSLNSQYGYNTWGVWRDNRNITPSSYSAKGAHHRNGRGSAKSYSIILTTAAFIILLAVITIAGLAFYFSSIKPSMDESLMGFQGTFHISKGDLFTTGLKYNHTTPYKQKVDFYKRFIQRSLSDNGLNVIRVEITSFGDGPLIMVHFRCFLDMKHIPKSIHNVEEYIKESLLLETTSAKSLYRNLKIDSETLEVKRILDGQLLKSAFAARDYTIPTSQTSLEKRLTKQSGTIEKKSQKSKILRGRDDEPDVDVVNAPVIQGSFEGSFEITKTDADITRKKTTPIKSVTSPVKYVTPFSTRVKSKKPTIEKVQAASTQRTSASSETEKTLITTTDKSTTTLATHAEAEHESTNHLIQVNALKTSTLQPNITLIPSNVQASDASNILPKLDVNLFTSVPILNTQPWKPIQAPALAIDSQLLSDEVSLASSSTTTFRPPSVQIIPNMNSTNRKRPPTNNALFYHSFTNPVFRPDTSEIERLGNANVRPHPLPVPLLDNVVVPAFKPINPTSGTIEKIPFQIEAADDQFEHIGGGVIVKKPEQNGTIDAIQIPNAEKLNSSSTLSRQTTEIPEKIEELLLKLLETDAEDNKHQTHEMLDVESRVESEEESSQKPTFLNIKELILSRNKEGLKNVTTEDLFPQNTRHRNKPTPLQGSDIQTKTMSSTLDDSHLFPTQSKWEFINGTSSDFNLPSHQMKKVFNNTLKAWVVRDIAKPDNITIDEMETRVNGAPNIQHISLIFDTLASKLGIAENNPMKNPPFSRNKIKQSHSKTSAATIVTTKAPSSTSGVMSGSLSSPADIAPDIFIGEAEVEVVDPNKYDEILKASSQALIQATTQSVPQLVTLLPVKSNSGIRRKLKTPPGEKSQNDENGNRDSVSFDQ